MLTKNTGINSLAALTAVNALTDISGGVSENLSIAPVFASTTDLHLTSVSPASVTGGGLDMSATFTTDKVGTTRPVPWSIGAYEY